MDAPIVMVAMDAAAMTAVPSTVIEMRVRSTRAHETGAVRSIPTRPAVKSAVHFVAWETT